MTPIVVIEPMVPADLDAAVSIDVSAFKPSELGAGTNDVRALREKQLSEELSRPFARVRVARGDGGVVLGYLLSWHVVDEVQLLNVAVALGARRQGIGRALMQDLLDHARASGAAKILLEVRTSNASAIALYESLGFSTFNVRTGYYADGEDAAEMMLSLVA